MTQPKKKLTERKQDKQASKAKTTWLSVLAVVIAIAGQLEAVEGFLSQAGLPPNVIGVVLGVLGLGGLLAMAISKEVD